MRVGRVVRARKGLIGGNTVKRIATSLGMHVSFNLCIGGILCGGALTQLQLNNIHSWFIMQGVAFAKSGIIHEQTTLLLRNGALQRQPQTVRLAKHIPWNQAHVSAVNLVPSSSKEAHKRVYQTVALVKHIL